MKRLAFCWATILVCHSGSGAYATDRCPGPNTQAISDNPFDITYESWVRQGSNGYDYGRCVEVKNTQVANIDWYGTQLSGLAKPGAALFVTFPFLTEDTDQRASEFRYGVNLRPEREKDVNFLSHKSEPKKSLADLIGERRLQVIQGEKVPQSLQQFESHAEISFADVKSKGEFRLTADFTSYLDVEAEYRYRFSYNLKAPSNFSDTKGINIQATDSFLKQAILESGYKNGLYKSGTTEGEVSINAKAGIVNDKTRRTTQGYSTLLVKINEDVVGSFPVSYLLPEERATEK